MKGKVAGRIGNYFEALFWEKIEDKVKQKMHFSAKQEKCVYFKEMMQGEVRYTGQNLLSTVENVILTSVCTTLGIRYWVSER